MYEKLVFEFPKEYIRTNGKSEGPDFVVQPQAYFRGASQIPGSGFNTSFQILTKPFFVDRLQHRHPEDEYLIFLGASFPDVFEFDAHIEFTLGKEGEGEEVYHITKPTIVRIPAGTYHCPLNFKEINKPILFLATCMMPMFGAVYDTPDGEKEVYYNGPVQCKYDEGKNCDACGKCLSEKWEA